MLKSNIMAAVNYKAFSEVPLFGDWDAGAYDDIWKVSLNANRGLVSVAKQFGIYACVFALILAIILFLLSAGNSKERAERKSHILYVIGVAFVLGAAISLVVLVAKIGLSIK